MRLELSLQNNVNVASAKRQKQLLLQKRHEMAQKPKIPSTRFPLKSQKSLKAPTPSTSNRLQKMHRGFSCTTEDSKIPKIAKIQKDQNFQKVAQKENSLTRSISMNISKGGTKGMKEVKKDFKVKAKNLKGEKKSQSLFRVERKVVRRQREYGGQKGGVKGISEYLKSRSKQMRPSVKLAEVKPCMMGGISGGDGGRCGESSLGNYMRERMDESGTMMNEYSQASMRIQSEKSNSRASRRNISQFIKNSQNITQESIDHPDDSSILQKSHLPAEIESEINRLANSRKAQFTQKEFMIQKSAQHCHPQESTYHTHVNQFPSQTHLTDRSNLKRIGVKVERYQLPCLQVGGVRVGVKTGMMIIGGGLGGPKESRDARWKGMVKGKNINSRFTRGIK